MNTGLVVISGCSGGGKSTLLGELRQRGHLTVLEPGRRVVEAEVSRGGSALPWTDMAAFARAALELAWSDLKAIPTPGSAFFDRGVIDAACALEHATGEPKLEALVGRLPYRPLVFLAPPWRDIYVIDEARKHGFESAVAEYGRLEAAYSLLGFDTLILPKTPVEARADFIMEALGASA
jgi:predicted ATPase